MSTTRRTGDAMHSRKGAASSAAKLNGRFGRKVRASVAGYDADGRPISWKELSTLAKNYTPRSK